MLLSRIITTALRIGMDSCKEDLDVENEYKVLQQFFLQDMDTRTLFRQTLSYGECCEIAQELDVTTLAKLIVIKGGGENE